MSILLDKNTRVIVQGITGKAGSFHASQMLSYGTRVVGGVTPGRGGTRWSAMDGPAASPLRRGISSAARRVPPRSAAAHQRRGTSSAAGRVPPRSQLPVFDTVAEAAAETGATATAIFVPAPFGAEAILEAAEAGLSLIVVITEGIPAQDMLKVKTWLKSQFPVATQPSGALTGSRPSQAWAPYSSPAIIGPNCPGLITPGQAKIGIMPGYIHKPGPVGLISRSGTLTYEAVWQLTRLGLGQSTCIGIGGDSLPGTGFTEVLKMFEADPETKAVVMIGEIGGSAEEEAALFIKKHLSKPVVAFVAGATAPKEKRMGHAGAVIAQGQGTHESKIKTLKAAGVAVADNPAVIGKTLAKTLRELQVQV